ncbi:MAG: hypothetical protein E6J91_30635 [Deltaproteobacteria bacterium]|nr:MAG: hypothetical protein E6J91_30635 [Deltaproteobacteria bacterium]
MPAPKQANISHTPPGTNGAPTTASASSCRPRPRHRAPCSARRRSAEAQPPAGAPAPWLHENSTPGLAAAASRRSAARAGSSSSIAVISVAANRPAARCCSASARQGCISRRRPISVAGVPSRAVKYTARAAAAGARSLRSSLAM